MTDSGENTHLNLDQSPEGGDSADVGSGEYYKQAVRGGYGGTEGEFDTLVEEQYNGHYPTAIRGLGFVEKPPVKSLAEDSVDLDNRALHLTKALNEFLEFSRAEGLDKAMHSSRKNEIRRHMGEVKINKTLQGMSGHLKKGNSEFHEGFGPSDDPHDERTQAMRFRETFTGTGKIMDKDKFSDSLYYPKK